MTASAPPLSDGETRRRRSRGLIALEILAWTFGLGALAAYGSAVYSRHHEAREAIRVFADARLAATTPVPDQRLWSPERVAAWKASLTRPERAPLGILRLARVGLEVPILEGTDDETLNRGAGHIEDTARPGENGNSGIAAHRDGFFRVLEKVQVGDVFEVETARGVFKYRLERTWIVSPDDVSVLDDTAQPSITLVTCYPFYYVGSAPRRFIVRAVLVPS